MTSRPCVCGQRDHRPGAERVGRQGHAGAGWQFMAAPPGLIERETELHLDRQGSISIGLVDAVGGHAAAALRLDAARRYRRGPRFPGSES